LQKSWASINAASLHSGSKKGPEVTNRKQGHSNCLESSEEEMSFGMGAAFNGPPTDDTTSAPPMTEPSPAQQMAQILSKQKKKKNPRAPEALAQQIGRAKRARQTGQKWG
jgi:hypothetical protein